MGADGVRYTATMLEELSTLKNIRYLRIGSVPRPGHTLPPHATRTHHTHAHRGDTPPDRVGERMT